MRKGYATYINAFLVILNVRLVSGLASQSGAENISFELSTDIRCNITSRDMKQWCDQDLPSNSSALEGTLCGFISENNFVNLYCSNGQWLPTSKKKKVFVRRVKRFHQMSCVWSGWWWWYRSYCTPINHTPYFRKCTPTATTFVTPRGQTSMNVYWEIPQAYDDEDGSLSVWPVRQVKSVYCYSSGWWWRSTYCSYAYYPHYGEVFDGSASGMNYGITYSTCDRIGACATCNFGITVKIIRCPNLPQPKNGYVDCPSGTSSGNTCTVTCNSCYTSNTDTTTCRDDGTWSKSLPLCTAKTCPTSLPSIQNGLFDCLTYTCGTSCFPKCNNGYTLKSGTYFQMSCSSNGAWTMSGIPLCQDATAPVLQGCPKNIVVVADIGKTSTNVTWIPPTATDNVDGNLTVWKIVGTIEPGSRVEAGLVYKIMYRATDNAWNPSEPCSFTVQVRVITCPSISVPANSTMVCSAGFIYGSNCIFLCQTGYLIQGSSTTFCNASGLWTQQLPTCQEITCQSPEYYGYNMTYGYYSCPTPIVYLDVCTPKCQQGFTLSKILTFQCLISVNNTGTYNVTAVPECIDNEPPVFANCANGTKIFTFTAEEGQTSAVVTWSLPTATDNSGQPPTVTQISASVNGSLLSANEVEYVKFKACDWTKILCAMCVYTVKVNIIKCETFIPSSNSQISCDKENIYGSNCSILCKTGFELNGPSTSMCQKNGNWTNRLTCQDIFCPDAPTPPDNGRYACPSTLYKYNTICYANCSAGFSLTQGSYIRCSTNRTWEVAATTICKDTTPPKLTGCKTLQTFYVNVTNATVEAMWTLPSTTDNFDPPSNITLKQLSGPTRGSALGVGEYIVQYQAIDTAENPSVTNCSISVNVEVVFCDKPEDSFMDKNLTFDCPSYQSGSVCIIGCAAGKSLFLRGQNTTECRSNISGNVPSTKWYYSGVTVPTCLFEPCGRNLHVPDNGALSYTQYLAFITCNDGYDLAVSSNGQLFCIIDTGLWRPSTVPDCSRKGRSGVFLPAGYYYSGTCDSPATITTIKNKVLTWLKNFEGTAFAPSCLANSTCTFEDVTVKCSNLVRKRRAICQLFHYAFGAKLHDAICRQPRQTSARIEVSFNISITALLSTPDDWMNYESALIEVSNLLNASINNGSFNIEGMPVVPNSFKRDEFSNVRCTEPGAVLEALVCKKCARGTYLSRNSTGSSTCKDCPVGTFVDYDGAIECIPCPNGTSTNTTRAKTASMCATYCPAGRVSWSGVEPCSPCDSSTFQDKEGQSYCNACPFGKTTFTFGSANCSTYDLAIGNIDNATVTTLVEPLSELTLSLWYLRHQGSSIKITVDSVLDVNISDNVTVQLHPLSMQMAESNFAGRWNNIVIVVQPSRMYLYLNGDMVGSRILSTNITFPAGNAVHLTVIAESEVLVSGLGMFDHALTAQDLAKLQNACIMSFNITILNSETLLKLGGYDIRAQPTACLAQRLCLSSPCGVHKCVDFYDGYFCECSTGYTGKLCESQIDPCSTGHCFNGGTCVSRNNSQSCLCTNHYTGKLCEQALDIIYYWTDWSSCTATCNGGNTTRTRVCETVYKSSSCKNETETEPCNTAQCIVDHCASSPCRNSSTCIASDVGYHCICASGKTGQQCQETVNHCQPSPCSHGTCINSNNTYICNCPSGYTGDLCDVTTVDGMWNEWSSWTSCSVSCGTGNRFRSRQCNNPAPGPGGKECVGSNNETETCFSKCYDACASSPCGDNNTCVEQAIGYTCHCANSYSGTNCSIPPNFCVTNPCNNGGKCSSGSERFTCTCVGRYSGDTCDLEPVLSSWNVWSEWSRCSATCNGGLRNRTRECDMRSATKSCQGDAAETDPCNNQTCPEYCAELPRKYGMLKTCNVTNETHICVFTCANGLFVANASHLNEVYKCGPETAYEWDQTQNIPSCAEGTVPSTISVSTVSPVTPAVSCDQASVVASAYSQSASSQACSGNSNCVASATVKNCGSRKRKQTGSSGSEIKITIDFHYANISTSDRSTVEAGINQSLWVLYNTGDTIDVEVNGIKYSADISNFNDTAEETVGCADGYKLYADVCVGCARGTMYHKTLGYCVYCQEGTFQELEGQMFCISCPDGTGSNVTGSWDKNDCMEGPKNDTTGKSKKIGVIVGAVVGTVVPLGILAAGIFYYRYRHRGLRFSNDTRNRTRASTDDLRQSMEDIHLVDDGKQNYAREPTSLSLGNLNFEVVN